MPNPAKPLRFRMKPVIIEALQLTWSNWSAICNFVPRTWSKGGCYLDAEGKPLPEDCTSERMGLIMQTLENQEFIAQEGDWIIKGVNGDFYPCKPDIFEATYEPMKDGE